MVRRTQRSQILAQDHDFCPPHLHTTFPLGGVPVPVVRILPIPFGGGKQEWCGYPVVKKKFEDIFIRFDRMYERDTDGRTPHDG